MSEWISVKDGLPQQCGEYLCFNDIYGIITAEYFPGAKQWWNAEREMVFRESVTHWMPLPEPPKED